MKRKLASRLLGQALRAVKWLLTNSGGLRLSQRSESGFPAGQWHRWNAANQRNRRQLRAYRRGSGRKIEGRLADLRRWMVQ